MAEILNFSNTLFLSILGYIPFWISLSSWGLSLCFIYTDIHSFKKTVQQDLILEAVSSLILRVVTRSYKTHTYSMTRLLPWYISRILYVIPATVISFSTYRIIFIFSLTLSLRFLPLLRRWGKNHYQYKAD